MAKRVTKTGQKRSPQNGQFMAAKAAQRPQPQTETETVSAEVAAATERFIRENRPALRELAKH